MEFVDVCKARRELCAAHIAKAEMCAGCPLKRHYCSFPNEAEAREVEPILVKWRKEHPVKTVADYFLEHLPNADIRPTGTPQVCCKAVGLATLATCKEMLEDCNACWRREWQEEK